MFHNELLIASATPLAARHRAWLSVTRWPNGRERCRLALWWLCLYLSNWLYPISRRNQARAHISFVGQRASISCETLYHESSRGALMQLIRLNWILYCLRLIQFAPNSTPNGHCLSLMFALFHLHQPRLGLCFHFGLDNLFIASLGLWNVASPLAKSSTFEWKNWICLKLPPSAVCQCFLLKLPTWKCDVIANVFSRAKFGFAKPILPCAAHTNTPIDEATEQWPPFGFASWIKVCPLWSPWANHKAQHWTRWRLVLRQTKEHRSVNSLI